MKFFCKSCLLGFLASNILGIVCCSNVFAISTRFTNLWDEAIFRAIVQNEHFIPVSDERDYLRNTSFSDPIIVQEFGLKTALDAACYFGRADICETMLEQGCRIDWDGLPHGDLRMTCLDAAFQSVLDGHSEMLGVVSNLVQKHPSTPRWRTMSREEILLEALHSKWVGTPEMEGAYAVVAYATSQAKPENNEPLIQVGTISNGTFRASSIKKLSGMEPSQDFPIGFLGTPVTNALHLLNHKYCVKGYLEQEASSREFSDYGTVRIQTDPENSSNQESSHFYFIRFFEMPYPGKENAVEKLIDIAVAQIRHSGCQYSVVPRTHCLSFFVYGFPVFHIFQ